MTVYIVVGNHKCIYYNSCLSHTHYTYPVLFVQVMSISIH